MTSTSGGVNIPFIGNIGGALTTGCQLDLVFAGSIIAAFGFLLVILGIVMKKEGEIVVILGVIILVAGIGAAFLGIIIANSTSLLYAGIGLALIAIILAVTIGPYILPLILKR